MQRCEESLSAIPVPASTLEVSNLVPQNFAKDYTIYFHNTPQHSSLALIKCKILVPKQLKIHLSFAQTSPNYTN